MCDTTKNLFEKVCSFENLLQAFYKARKGKRSKGNIAKFEANLEHELFRLKSELESGEYRPGPYTTFDIFEPKKRMISAAPFRDRVVHHALCNIIEPIVEPSFIFHTYANRKGKGSHAAIRQCQQMLRKYPWVLKCDIKKYFPSIDHAVLKLLVVKKIGCPRTRALVFLIIDCSNPQEIVSDFFPGDDLFTSVHRRRGLPMGNLTSQFLANFYLSPLDHFVNEQLPSCKGYIRYVDDFVVFADKKAELKKAQDDISSFLIKYRLVMHPAKCHINPSDSGVSFLGQQIFRTHRLLKSDNVQRFYVRLRACLNCYDKNKLSPSTFEARLNSWVGHAGQADTYRLRNRIFRQLRFGENLPLFMSPVGTWRLLATD